MSVCTAECNSLVRVSIGRTGRLENTKKKGKKKTDRFRCRATRTYFYTTLRRYTPRRLSVSFHPSCMHTPEYDR